MFNEEMHVVPFALRHIGVIIGFWPFDWRWNFQREGRGFHANFGPFVITVAA